MQLRAPAASTPAHKKEERSSCTVNSAPRAPLHVVWAACKNTTTFSASTMSWHPCLHMRLQQPAALSSLCAQGCMTGTSVLWAAYIQLTTKHHVSNWLWHAGSDKIVCGKASSLAYGFKLTGACVWYVPVCVCRGGCNGDKWPFGMCSLKVIKDVKNPPITGSSEHTQGWYQMLQTVTDWLGDIPLLDSACACQGHHS